MLLVSPAEPAALRDLGEVSSLPETYGVDFLWPSPAGMIGVQRKEVRDLVASVRGDRIARELGQSGQLEQVVLLVEGEWRWQSNGDSITVPGFTRSQWDGLLLSFQQEGWWVLFSRDLQETMEVLGRMQSWFSKDHHGSLRTRPKSRAMWGTAQNRDWSIHWWQSFDGIGVEMAGRLHHHLGVPVCWTVTEKELLAVPGIGKVRARSLIAALTDVRQSNGEGGHDE